VHTECAPWLNVPEWAVLHVDHLKAMTGRHQTPVTGPHFGKVELPSDANNGSPEICQLFYWRTASNPSVM